MSNSNNVPFPKPPNLLSSSSKDNTANDDEEEQLTAEEQDLLRLDVAIVQEILNGTGILVQYAINNLHRLVINAQGQVIWPEAFNLLRMVASQRASYVGGKMHIPAPTLEEYCDVLEFYCAKGLLNYSNLDAAINALPMKLRVLVYAGMETAKQAISTRPDVQQEFAEKREDLLLKLMYGAKETRQSYDILAVRPHLLKFLTDYVLMQLGIEVINKPISRRRLQYARVIDFSTNPPTIKQPGAISSPL